MRVQRAKTKIEKSIKKLRKTPAMGENGNDGRIATEKMGHERIDKMVPKLVQEIRDSARNVAEPRIEVVAYLKFPKKDNEPVEDIKVKVDNETPDLLFDEEDDTGSDLVPKTMAAEQEEVIKWVKTSFKIAKKGFVRIAIDLDLNYERFDDLGKYIRGEDSNENDTISISSEDDVEELLKDEVSDEADGGRNDSTKLKKIPTVPKVERRNELFLDNLTDDNTSEEVDPLSKSTSTPASVDSSASEVFEDNEDEKTR